MSFFEECEAEIAFWKLRFESQNDEILQYKEKLIKEAQEKDEMQGYCRNMVEMNKTLLEKTALFQEENMQLLEKIRVISINYQELLNENARIGLKIQEKDDFSKNKENLSLEIENFKEKLKEKERIIEEKKKIIRDLKTMKNHEISEIVNVKNREILDKTDEFQEKYDKSESKYRENKEKCELIQEQLMNLKEEYEEIQAKNIDFQGKSLRLQEEVIEKTQIINALKARNKTLIREVNNKENIRDFDGELMLKEMTNRSIFLIKMGLMMNFEGFSEDFLKEFRGKEKDIEFLRDFIENTQRKILEIYIENGIKNNNTNNETKGFFTLYFLINYNGN